jgi:thermitase
MTRRARKRSHDVAQTDVVRSKFAPPVPIVPAFFRLFYQPRAAVAEILARPPSWRAIFIFLAIISLLRTTLEAAWDLLMKGELFNTLRQPGALWAYRVPFTAFFGANLATAYLRVVLFAFIALAVGKFLGGKGRFEPLLRLYGVILGLFALTIVPDYLAVWIQMPFVAFRAAPTYNPEVGVGQLISSIWLGWITYVAVRTAHRIKPFDALQTAAALALANTGLLVLVAMGVLNLPFMPSTVYPGLVAAGNVAAFASFLMLAVGLYAAGRWVDGLSVATLDPQVDFKLRGYFRPHMSLVPLLPRRYEFVWALVALFLIGATLIAGIANWLIQPTPRVHAAGLAAPAWILRARSAPAASYRQDQILVSFRPDVTPSARAAVLARHGLHERAAIADIGVLVAAVPPGLDARDAVAALGGEPAVGYAEPDYLVHAVGTLTPNDTYWNKNYASSHYGSVSQYGPRKINAPTAWGTNSATNSIKLAVVDTGIDNTHPDLSGRVLSGYNYVANDANTTDDNGHGTHVAGIAASISNNKTGIASICFNACAILPVKVLDNTGSGSTSGVANGVTYAADQGARVINLSLGSTAYSQALQSAVDYAWGKNAVLVAAGGNDGSATVEYPAGDDHVLGVAATDANDADTYFSDWGNQIGVAAPGNAILSTMPTYATYLTNSGYYKNYDALSGTSMASPHVAGLAGLLIADKKGSISNLAVYQSLQRGADAVSVSYPPAANGGWEPHNGYGRLDAGNTINATYRTATVGSIVGQVTDSGGNALAGVTVSAGGTSATTGSDGMYRLANLAAAGSPYTATASASGYSFTSQPVTVTSGADVFATFQAQAASNAPTTIQNGGFESGAFSPWVTGGGAPSPVLSTTQTHTGLYSAQLGQSAGAEPTGDSSVYQTVQVSIPSGATKATLTFWYWPYTTDTVTFDWQECQIRNTSGATLAQVMKIASNAQSWQQVTYDLTTYNGQTIQVYFNDHEDGSGDLTYMYLDDVALTYS